MKNLVNCLDDIIDFEESLKSNFNKNNKLKDKIKTVKHSKLNEDEYNDIKYIKRKK